MRRVLAAAVILMCLMTATSAFSQSSLATVSGTVSDGTGALIPGVSVTATNTATNVVTSVVSNEAGAYTVPGLLPGTYKLTAELPGFQTQTYTDVVLGNAAQVRLNFSLSVASVAQSVEVTVAADTVLAQSSPTIGQVLTQQRVQDLPLVGNNVLDLIGVMSGVDNIATGAFGREGTTFAGVSAAYISTVRDGVMVQDTRFPTGINSATVINPDLVGEVRLILAPVDAEIGRGNGTVQIQTRSGTNQYRGAAVWSFRNTVLDPNTWSNNRNLGGALLPNWTNTHQGTVSLGGPIIKNKTFFYTLFDMNDAASRSNTNPTVLTPCARNGIFRYFDQWNNGNAMASTTTGQNPQTSVVDALGNPRPPAANPNGTPHNGILRYTSIYGPVTNIPTRPDCSDAIIGRAPTANGMWDQYRTQRDPTGFVDKIMALMPQANNYDTGDGLNTAGHRFLRRTSGLDNLFGVGEATGIRKQINIKIDQNFSSRHKGNVNVSYERVHSDDVVEGWPEGTWSNLNYRRPLVITASFTSTLSPSLLNEARFGIRRTGTNVVAPWDRPEFQDEINAFLPAPVNGFRVLPRLAGGFCSPISGSRPPGSCNGGQFTSTAQDVTPVWTYSDTLSWTKGKHSYRFGGELRLSSSSSKVSNPGFFSDFSAHAQAIGGQTTAAAIPSTGANSVSSQNPLLSGLANTTAGTLRNIMNFYAGSLSSITNLYFLTDGKKLDDWSDYRTSSHLRTSLNQTEFSAFFKDDYKVHKNLTLNLGVRYEYYGVPYVASGTTVSPVGGGLAAFGISGRGFDSWHKLGSPIAYDPNLLTALEFVGPNSPNPDKTVYPNDWNNLGPAVGFAWQVPWFGEGKTTMRGGYQVTFQGGGRFSTLEPILSAPPGSTYPGQYTGDSSNSYLDLTDLAVALPSPAPSKPMQPIRINDRGVSYTAFDPNYVSPYVQNLTMSLTRSVRNNLTVDVRYVGTLAVKQFRSFNLNIRNFLTNGLLQEFTSIRAGGESPMLDLMFNGINLCTGNLCGNAANFAAVGSTVNGVRQTAALQMRSSSTFNGDLANGDFLGIATTLNTLNYVKTGGANPSLPEIPAGVRGAVMRYSGRFPENFIVTNPQFNNVTYMTNLDHNNYHSIQTEVTLRPTLGMSVQGTYAFSKNLGLGPLTNPMDRAGDYTIVGGNRAHQFRANGVFELPIGPNRLLFGNSAGLVARLTEGWQIGWIYNASSGAPTNIGAQSMLYGNGTPDIVGPLSAKELFKSKGVRWGVPVAATGQLNGTYFDTDRFVSVPDPQCAGVTTLQNLHGTTSAQGVFTARCGLDALAMIVPAGTAGSFVLNDGSARSAQIVLQNPLPGKRGTLGSNVIEGLGTWRFDANVSKSLRISEGKRLQMRIDATNVLNHPQPGGPNLNINLGAGTNPTPFGGITNKTGTRAFQGQVRLNF